MMYDGGEDLQLSLSRRWDEGRVSVFSPHSVMSVQDRSKLCHYLTMAVASLLAPIVWLCEAHPLSHGEIQQADRSK